jgi:DNA-binding response OmpR family regulator
MVTEMLRGVLEEAGFTISCAATAEEALEALAEGHEAFTALVTDIDLRSNISGWDLARYARRSRPDIPIVFMSASSAHEWPVRGVPQSTMLPKPFTAFQILQSISTLLAGEGEAPMRISKRLDRHDSRSSAPTSNGKMSGLKIRYGLNDIDAVFDRMLRGISRECADE